MKKQSVTLLFAIGCLTAPAAAQWRAEAWFGDARNAPTAVTFHQEGQPDIKIDGEWTTRPWQPTWYYSARVAKWDGESAWAFQYQHHKLYLENPTAEVTRFRITNGVNMLLGEHLWRHNAWEFGVAAGPVFAVPISTVRDQPMGGAKGIFHSVYEFGGAALQANVARRVKLIPYTYGSFTVKATASRLHVSIADGKADLMNYALHFQYGLSLQSTR